MIEIISNLSDVNTSETTSESRFQDLGFDNLDMAELVMNIEDRLSITAGEHMYYANTVAELIEQIDELNIKVSVQ